MIETNSFCVVLEKKAFERVRRKFEGITRFRKEITEEEIKVKGKKAKIISFALQGRGLPAVHGICYNEKPLEYALFDLRDGDLYLERDRAGTRPIYVSEEIIATDHRVFEGEFRLLPVKNMFSRKCCFEGSEEEAARILASKLDDAVKKRVIGRKRVAVSFSGGLDSSLIAYLASLYTSVILVSVHASGSRDESQARKSAEILGLPLVQVKVTENEVRSLAGSLELPYPPSPMDRALFSIYTVASRKARELGCEIIMLGQMADELFGGYMKYLMLSTNKGSEVTERTMLADLGRLSEEGLLRDEIACSRFILPSFPYSDSSVVDFSLSLPFEYKIKGGVRKYILRKAGEILGIDSKILHLEKKAAQFSSGVQKLIGL